MRKNYHWLILYDIRNVRRLAHVARIMESYAVRVQKSVFESDADEKTITVNFESVGTKKLAKGIAPLKRA